MTEPQGQPNESDEIQAFLGWVEKNRENGTLGSSDGVDCPFLPWKRLEAHLKAPRRLRNILKTLFPGSDSPPISVDDVQGQGIHYVKILAILLLINQGRYIRLMVTHPSLCDDYLPFLSKPKHFPRLSDGDDTLWNNFHKKQFQLCPHTFVCGATGTNLEVEVVLPIVKKDLISRGGSAAIYKIKIYAEYDQLSSKDQPNQNIKNRPANTYAIKSYNTKDAEVYYRHEVTAFRHLASAKDKEQSLVAFYGSFISKGRYNLILEYADFAKGNTLELYFHNVKPPTKSHDIILFWKSLFALIQALSRIHDLKKATGEGGPDTLQGWHQDVDPSNILVFSSKTGSDYDVDFKLADLGLSHFKKVGSLDTDATDVDAWGTRIYGAPECCRYDDFIESTSLYTKRSVDIWSLGCVFSEAAAWVVYGDVDEYRDRRKFETSKLDDFRDGPAFHDNQNVLQAVVATHKHIQEEGLRAGDYVTGDVITQMIGMMLEVSPDKRPTALVLHGCSSRILQTAANKIQGSNPREFGAHDHSSLDSRLIRAPDSSSPARPVVTSVRSDPTSSVSESPLNSEHMASAERAMTLQHGAGGERYPPLPGGYLPSDTPTKVKRDRSPTNAYGGSPDIQRLRVQNEEEESSADVTAGSNGAYTPNNRNSRNSRHRRKIEGSSSSPKSSFSRAVVASEPMYYTESNTQAESRDTGPPSPLSTRRRDAEKNHSDFVRHPQSRAEVRPPKLSLGKAKEHISVSKQATRKLFQRSRKSSLREFDEGYLNDLNGRDHVFLIDDSESMGSHWPSVMELLYVLAWLIKRRDPDGFDLFFTVSADDPENRNFRDGTPARDYLSKITPRGQSNMGLRLNNLLAKYNIRRKALSVYVFTDGNWQFHADPDAPIRNMVETLNRDKLPKDRIGIQFIQFGTHPEGTKRLKHLDTGLGKSIKREMMEANPKLDIGSKVWDIVDTEPYSDGDILKMLLGAVNRWFDDDEDDESDDGDGVMDEP